MSRGWAETGSPPGPLEVFEHYLRSREALMHLKMTLLNSPDQISKESRFWGMTSDEVGDAFGRLAKELDIQINLLLIASSEARLRVDFLDRVKKRGKDSISRRFREIEQRRKARAKKGVRLEDILEAWASELTGRPGGNSAGPMGKLFLY